MRLIDADALKNALTPLEATGGHKYYRAGMETVLHEFMPKFIDDAPTIDAVEVVRCKDCILCYESFTSSTGYKCSVWGLYGDDCECSPEGFCNKAMRRYSNA